MSSTTATVSSDLAAVNQSWIALVIISLFLSLTILIVGLRIYTRIYLLKQLGWDDYFVIIVSVDGGVVLSTIPYGLGRHTATLDPSLLVSYLRNFWLSIVLYNLSLAMIKLTFLFQYYRVLSIHKMKRVILVLGCIIMAWAISQLLVVIFTCMPVQKFWETDLAGKCMPNLPFWYINAAGNIASDLAIFIMPLPVLNRLQLRKKQKYFLMGIFSLGFFTCAISLIRLAYLKQGPDFTFDNVPTACWSFGELSCGVICACLPTLRPLMTKIKPQWMTSYGTRNRRQTYGVASGHPKYGDGTRGNNADLKSSTGNRTRKTQDTSLTLSTANLNKYSRFDDDNDIEEAMHMPTPLSPAYRKHDTSSSDSESIFGNGNDNAGAWTAMGQEGVQMQQLPPKSKQSHKAPDNDKAMEVLGMGFSGGGVSTQVVGGRHSTFLPNNGGVLGGIAVKRDVTVTTTPISDR